MNQPGELGVDLVPGDSGAGRLARPGGPPRFKRLLLGDEGAGGLVIAGGGDGELAGRATPTAPLGFGANPGRMMYTDDTRTKVNFVPMFFQMDSIGYNAGKIPAVNNELSWGELFNPKWRGKVAMFGIDWLGMLNAAMGMRALGLLNPVDISNMT